MLTYDRRSAGKRPWPFPKEILIQLLPANQIPVQGTLNELIIIN